MPRPPHLAKEEFLDTSLRVFWSKGYDRTSLTDLCKTLGLGPSSIYNTFGSKEELFRRAIDHYVDIYLAPAMKIVSTPSSQNVTEFVSSLIRTLIKIYTDKENPLGCAIFQGSSAASPKDAIAAEITLALKTTLRKSLKQRFTDYAKAGESLSSAPTTLALFVIASLEGLSQLACDGIPRNQLLKVADHVVQSCICTKPI